MKNLAIAIGMTVAGGVAGYVIGRFPFIAFLVIAGGVCWFVWLAASDYKEL